MAESRITPFNPDKTLSKPGDKSAYSMTYFRLRPSWRMYLDLFEPLSTDTGSTENNAGPGARSSSSLSQFLFKYKSEDASEFSERLKRLAQVNYVDYIVQFWSAILFSSPPRITCSDASQKDVFSFLTNCNGGGDSLIDYARDVIVPSVFLYGITDVVVDMPQKKTVVVTVADEGEYEPYCYVIPPLNRLQWELDDYGNRYVKYRSFDIINTQISPQMGTKDPCQYQDWTPETVASYDTSGSAQTTVTNPYGFIPIVPVTFKPSLRFFNDAIGISLVKDVAPLQKLLINVISLIMDWQEQTNYALRVLIQDTSGNFDPEMDAPTEGEGMEMNSKRVIRLFGAGSDLKSTAPDPAGADNMMRWMNSLVAMMFLACGLPQDVGENKTHQSSMTVRANYSKILNQAHNFARALAKNFKKIIETSLRVRGYTTAQIKEANIQVMWDVNYSYQSFGQSLLELQTFKAIMADMSPAAVAIFTKSVVDPKLYTSEDYQKFIEEIDDWAEDESAKREATQEVQMEALTNPPEPESPPVPPATSLDAEDDVDSGVDMAGD